MNECCKCNTRIHSHLWIVEGNIFCSPRCERSAWDAKEKKWTTKKHRYGDSTVKKIGCGGIKK